MVAEHDLAEWLTHKRMELASKLGRRVSQAEIAEKAGISRQHYSFLEGGLNPGTGKPIAVEEAMARRLARALDASESEALQAAGLLADDERELIRRYRSLDQRTAEGIRRMLETLVPNPPLSAGMRPAALGVPLAP